VTVLQGRFTEAEIIFDGIKDEDPRALYQLAVMYYDGLGTKEDLVRTFLFTISLRSTVIIGFLYVTHLQTPAKATKIGAQQSEVNSIHFPHLKTFKDSPVVSYENVNRWYLLLLKLLARIISTYL